jgi:hypothetical protein
MAFGNNNFQQARKKKNFRLFVLPLFVFALLAAQALVLQHHHDGNFTHHVDCSICIKQGSESDALPITASLSQPTKRTGSILSVPYSEQPATLLTTRSRGPPLVIS